MFKQTFLSLQFSYWPLIRKIHSRNRINRIHRRASKLVYEDSLDLTLQELLGKDKSVSLSPKNLQLLATEIFKSKTGMFPELMNHTFHFVEVFLIFSLKSNYTLERKQNYTVYHGSESLFSWLPNHEIFY